MLCVIKRKNYYTDETKYELHAKFHRTKRIAATAANEKNIRMKRNICFLIVLSIAVACNKPMPNLLQNGSGSSDSTNVNVSNSRVLYLVLDGARGQAVKDIASPNITTLARRAVYTYFSHNNESGVLATSWSDMLTGVDSTRHNVTTADFANNNFTQYPSLFTRLKELYPAWRTVAYSRNQSLSDNLLSDATINGVSQSDADITNKIINDIQTQDSKLIFGEYSGIDSAGKVDGYQSTTPSYKNAILNIDSSIGQIMNAITSRSNYSKENWMVVIASSQGGELPYTGNDTTDYNNPVGNGFLIFYNNNYVYNYYSQPSKPAYTGSTPEQTGTSTYAQIKDTNAYNITANNEMTISFKLKVVSYGSLNPGIIKKTASSANSNQGWWFCHNGANGSIRFVLRGTGSVHGGTNNTITSVAGYQGTNEWHSYSGKVYMSGGKRYMQLYIDGLPSTSAPIEVTGLDCTTATAFDIGQRGSYVSGTTTEMVTDVKIFNTALPDDVIAQNACKIDIDSNDAYYSHLIGYWPCTDGSGGVLTDYSSSGNDLQFYKVSGSTITTITPSWYSFNDISNNICPTVGYSFYSQNPRSIDIPFEIYSWLGITIPFDWNLMGKYWSATNKNVE